ncbi:MAG: glycoside hydrolase family 95 protein [Acetatifactor sp.]|nr:glycoside hydrolase family 95 protein [Acetatifactor sp.]
MSKLWYRQPAEIWEEALPLGNGRVGAMVFGKVNRERIQVNEESVWLGRKRNRINPDAADYMGEIQEAVFGGQIQKAQRLLDMAAAGCPDSMNPYQTLGDVGIEIEGSEKIENYERSLDLEDGTVRVAYESEGIAYRREIFASHPEDCLVMRFTADPPGRITLRANLSRGKYFDRVGRAGRDTIYLYGDQGSEGISFLSALRALQTGGEVRTVGQNLCVENAEEVILLFTAATTWQKETVRGMGSLEERFLALKERAEKIFARASAFSYAELWDRHVRDYRSLYGRVQLELEGCGRFDALPADERLRAAGECQADPGLGKLLFDFGRYLMISCSRPGGLPATLQGIWNQDFLPPWDSKYTININTQMNYWIAESCNLSECHLPLFDLLSRMRESGGETARKMYGCRGFVAHHNTDIHGDCAPQDTWYPATYWVMGAAWLCTHIWNHYEYTLDIRFLKEYYPIIKEAVSFFLDFLVEKDGYLVTCPSVSPENTYRLPGGESGAVTYGPAMDNQILRDLFGQCLQAAEILQKAYPEGQAREGQAGIGEQEKFLEQVRRALGMLRPDRISGRGTLMEWVEDYEECEPGHRHISHLYGLHPSGQITVDGTPELARAAAKTLESRLSQGGGHTGWSRAWIINLYAKLWDGEKAYANLEQLLSGSTYPNLFDRHPPFQIDGNFGAAAAIAQMLIQSSGERVVLLPALPRAWESGSVKGLRIRGNAQVELEWKEHRLTACRITAYSALRTRVLYEGRKLEVQIPAGETHSLPPGAFF